MEAGEKYQGKFCLTVETYPTGKIGNSYAENNKPTLTILQRVINAFATAG